MNRYVKNFKLIDSLRQKLEVNRANPDLQIKLTEAFVKLNVLAEDLSEKIEMQ